jgi:hypothetical protein
MPTKFCLICGLPFRPRPGKQATQKCCSRPCFFLSRQRQVQKQCERCGAAFSVYQARSDARFCSRECRKHHVEVKCAYCDAVFSIQSSKSSKRLTCSRRCAALLRAKEGRAPMQGVILSPRFRAAIAERTRRYYAGDPTKHWNYRGGPGVKRGASWSKQRDLARDRDGHSCQACLVHASDYGKRMPVHHIVPFREFATHEAANHLDNLICLCQSCHMKMEHGTLRLLVRRDVPIETIPLR